ncbi:ER membrane protein complex subunit 2 [Phytophthora cinnamomi]|uniref:ER membrane protein complex subunit 2 n=1 Tax=Phytophthora cinnamomi TaxID=4785 RepID=UPI00355A1102|nr:ER membrane protein complex subunit 2 [Phytophthora cinnamomi]
MDYRQYQPQQAPTPTQAQAAMLSSARGMARLNGSNRAAWNAMDLQIGAQAPPPNARGLAPEDGGALSARNVLLRQKLRERKRYDSADDAMKKAAARAASRYEQPQQQQTPQPTQLEPCERPFSPAQIGQKAFFNAMQSDAAASAARPKRNVQRNTPTALHEPPGGAELGRNVLIQRKLQSKTSFDSADYQMARARRGQQAADAMEDSPMEDVEEVAAVSSPCASSAAAASRRQQFASMSPSRAGKYGALENKKKPSRRDLLDQQQREEDPAKAGAGSNYGKLSAAHVLIRRKLKERKRFDSADYAMEKQGQPTDVPADVAANPAAPGTAQASRYGALGTAQTSINHQVKHIKLSEDPSGRVASPAQPVGAKDAQAALAARAARYAGLRGAGNANPTPASNSQAALDRYGLDKSSAPSGAAAARNVVLQRKLAERKMFDSADHFKKAA